MDRFDPFDPAQLVGVPVATFVRWMFCPKCQRLAPLSSDMFEQEGWRPEQACYVHRNFNKAIRPRVVPARFLVACDKGHLDDFPRVNFVHGNNPCSGPILSLVGYGLAGEAVQSTIAAAIEEAGRRGVHIRICLETHTSGEGQVGYDTVAALGSVVRQYSQIYTWPLGQRLVAANGRLGILHVKCAVADETTMFISSANLTGHVLNANMEILQICCAGRRKNRS